MSLPVEWGSQKHLPETTLDMWAHLAQCLAQQRAHSQGWLPSHSHSSQDCVHGGWVGTSIPTPGAGDTDQPLTQPSGLITSDGAKVGNEDTTGGQFWGLGRGLFRHFLPGGLSGGGGTNREDRIEANVV